MSTFNGTLKKWNLTDWDTLYPKTIGENIVSGTVALARIPTMDAAHIPSLDASKIGTGTINAGLLPAIAITNVASYTDMAAFLSAYTSDHNIVQGGDVVILTTPKLTYIHNGGTAWASTDLTLLQTPTDVVTSVAGQTGVVTLVKADVGLGSVDNTTDVGKPVSTAQATAIGLKADKVTITAATKTKITYNAQGIVTAGADIADTDIPALAIAKTTGLQTALDAKAPLLEPVFVNNATADYVASFDGIAGSLNYLAFKLAGVLKARFSRVTGTDNFNLSADAGDLMIGAYGKVDISAQSDVVLSPLNGRAKVGTNPIWHAGNAMLIVAEGSTPANPDNGQVIFEY